MKTAKEIGTIRLQALFTTRMLCVQRIRQLSGEHVLLHPVRKCSSLFIDEFFDSLAVYVLVLLCTVKDQL